MLAAALLGAAVSGAAVWTLVRPAPAAVVRTSIVVPRDHVLSSREGRNAVVSPTGTHIVYAANGQLYARAIDAFEAEPLSDTEGRSATGPFFSPAGRWVGFWSRDARALMQVALSGGAAVTLTRLDSVPVGATWQDDDTIVIGGGSRGIVRLPGASGQVEDLVALDDGGYARWPQILPDGDHVLYTLTASPAAEIGQIVVERLERPGPRDRTVVVERGLDARYLPTGHLVYSVGGTLLAAPFDLARLEVSGGAVPVIEGVAHTFGPNADISASGVLVYLDESLDVANRRTLVWVDQDHGGREEPVPADPRAYRIPRISPDGTRVAIELDDQQFDTWIYDFGRDALTRFTFGDAESGEPVWSPDGRAGRRAAGGAADSDGVRRAQRGSLTERRWLAYQSNESGQFEVYVRPFPDVDEGRWQVSNHEATQPVWGPEGRELYYRTGSDTITAVAITTEPAFASGRPAALFTGRYLDATSRAFDIAPDGTRFLMIKEGAVDAADNPFAGVTRIRIVQNWFSELERLVPTP